MTKDEIVFALTERIGKHDVRASETSDIAAPMYVGELHRIKADIYRDALRLVKLLSNDEREDNE